MVEVFKTNVEDRASANMLLDRIHNSFLAYEANFDLEDCDRILRVLCEVGDVEIKPLITLLRNYGFTAEVLPDEPAPAIETTSAKCVFFNFDSWGNTSSVANF